MEEGVIGIYELYMLCEDIKYVVDCISTDSDDEIVNILENFVDGESNTDIEIQFEDIKNSLMYNDEVTALSEISQRLELIDTRLDREFIALNECFSFISTLLLCFVSFKFLNWIVRAFTV